MAQNYIDIMLLPPKSVCLERNLNHQGIKQLIQAFKDYKSNIVDYNKYDVITTITDNVTTFLSIMYIIFIIDCVAGSWKQWEQEGDLACLPLARLFFLAPTTSKSLLLRLYSSILGYNAYERRLISQYLYQCYSFVFISFYARIYTFKRVSIRFLVLYG